MPVTNEQIRRAHPSVDSPLGRYIAGKIDEATYYAEMNRKRIREEGPEAPPVTPTSHPIAPRSA